MITPVVHATPELSLLSLGEINPSHHYTPLAHLQIQAGIREITPNNQWSVLNEAHMETISLQHVKTIPQSRGKRGMSEGRSAGKVLHGRDNCRRTETKPSRGEMRVNESHLNKYVCNGGRERRGRE